MEQVYLFTRKFNMWKEVQVLSTISDQRKIYAVSYLNIHWLDGKLPPVKETYTNFVLCIGQLQNIKPLSSIFYSIRI